MKEKINMVQLNENQEQQVKGGHYLICNNPDYYPVCRCKLANNRCAHPIYACPK